MDQQNNLNIGPSAPQPVIVDEAKKGKRQLVLIIVISLVIVLVVGAVAWAISRSVTPGATETLSVEEQERQLELDLKLGPGDQQLPADYPKVVPEPPRDARLRMADAHGPTADTPDRPQDYMANYAVIGTLEDIYNYYVAAIDKSSDLRAGGHNLNPTNASVSGRTADGTVNVNIHLSQQEGDDVVEININTRIMERERPGADGGVGPAAPVRD